MGKSVRCPGCNVAISVTPDLEGMRVECPNCGAPFDVPADTFGRLKSAPIMPRVGEGPSPEKAAPVGAQAASPKAPARSRDQWDLPTASPPDPRAALADGKKRRQRIITAVGIVLLVMVVSLVLAAINRRPGIRFESARDLVPMDQDVTVGRWRFRVTGADWRREASETPGETGPQVLDVVLSVTNLDNSPRAMPPVKLGTQTGRDLGSEFGTPVLREDDGSAVSVLQPGRTVRGHVVFQPRFDEYCLIVSGDGGREAGKTARIALTPRLPARVHDVP